MRKTIIDMKNSLKDDYCIVFVSANDNYEFTLRKEDNYHFIDEKTLVIHRENDRTTIINLKLIIAICVRRGADLKCQNLLDCIQNLNLLPSTHN